MIAEPKSMPDIKMVVVPMKTRTREMGGEACGSCWFVWAWTTALGSCWTLIVPASFCWGIIVWDGSSFYRSGEERRRKRRHHDRIYQTDRVVSYLVYLNQAVYKVQPKCIYDKVHWTRARIVNWAGYPYSQPLELAHVGLWDWDIYMEYI